MCFRLVINACVLDSFIILSVCSMIYNKGLHMFNCTIILLALIAVYSSSQSLVYIEVTLHPLISNKYLNRKLANVIICFCLSTTVSHILLKLVVNNSQSLIIILNSTFTLQLHLYKTLCGQNIRCKLPY